MNVTDIIKQPPNSVDAEQAIIAAVIQKNSVIHDVDHLTETDFYQHAHKLMWRHMQALALQGRPIDPVVLCDALDGAGELESVGQEYIVDLIVNGRGAANVEHYARIIRDRAISRRIIQAGYELSEIGFSSEDTRAKLDQAQGLVMDLDGQPAAEAQDINQVLKKTIADLDRRVKNKGQIIGLETGFVDFDRLTNGLCAGDMVVVAARPAMGKTTFAMNVAEHATRAGKFCIFFSLEMPSEQLMLRTFSSGSKVSFDSIRKGAVDEGDWSAITATVANLKDKHLVIDDASGLTSAQLLSRARKISQRKQDKPALIVIDYLQLLRDEGENETAKATSASANVKSLARQMGCPVIVLSQLNRALENRPNKRPQMSDLRQSGAIEQDADIICFVYRDEVYNEKSERKGIAELIIGKQRNGPIGTVFLSSRLDICRFDTLAHEYHPAPETQQWKGRKHDGFAD